MAEQAAQTITPGTANKTIAANRYLTGTQTILGDKNLVAANIIRGKTIFGVKGTAVYAGDIKGYFLEPPKEYEALTGGWEAQNDDLILTKGTITYDLKIAYSQSRNDSNGSTYLYMRSIGNKIDFSKYRYVYVDYSGAYYTQSNTDRVWLQVNGGINAAQVKLALTKGSENAKSGTIKLDVSNLNTISMIQVGFHYDWINGRSLCTAYAKVKAIRYDEIG